MVLVATGSTHVEKEFGEVEILLFSGDAIQFHETHLDDLVAWPDVIELVGLGPERVAKQIGFFQGNMEKVRLAGRLVMSSRGFEKMARVVKFMAVDWIHLPAFVTGPAMRIFGIDRPRGVKVTIRFLGFADLGDEIVEVSAHLRIRL